MMHTGQMKNLRDVINHYQNIPVVQGNNRLDNRLRPNGQPQKLKMTETEISNVITFLNTLGGNNVYTNKKWADPFLLK
jgi:cytochrome c peroxidase